MNISIASGTQQLVHDDDRISLSFAIVFLKMTTSRIFEKVAVSNVVRIYRSTKVYRNERAKIRLICKLLRFSLSDVNNADEEDREQDRFVRNLNTNDVRELTDSMRRARYSRSYLLSVLVTVARRTNEISRLIIDENLARYDDGLRHGGLPCTSEPHDHGGGTAATIESGVIETSRRSLKTDGILTFTENEFVVLIEHVRQAIHADGPRDDSERLFLYTFYMLTITGKRLSDVCGLDARSLIQLSERGVCVVRIRKTDKLGRVEIPEILGGGGGDRAERRREATDAIATLRVFLAWIDDGSLSVPFNRETQRRRLDRELSSLYVRSFAREKPKGLSFHALRRIYAGYRFLHGHSVSALQENLDHSNRAQTNRYVNACLYELLNRR